MIYVLLFILLQSIAAAISFVYSSHLGLHAQMAILLVFGVIGTVSFCLVEWSLKKKADKVPSSTRNSDKLRIEVHSD